MDTGEIRLRVLAILHSSLSVQAGVFLFGSRARKDHQAFSDFDIGLIAREPIDPQEIRHAKALLEESNLPFTVDLVDFRVARESFVRIAAKEIEVWSNPFLVNTLLKNTGKPGKP